LLLLLLLMVVVVMMMMMMMMMMIMMSLMLFVGSPFQCVVTDPNNIAVAWESIRLCPAKQPVQLDLDLKAMSPSDLDVKVTGL